MKVIKKIIMVLGLYLVVILGANTAKAATGYLTVASSSDYVVVGNNVNVYVTLSSSSPLGSWDFTINYDSSKLRLIQANTESGGNRSVSYSNGSEYSKTYTFTFSTIASGYATVWINDALVYAFDTSQMTMVNGSAGMTLRTQQEIIDSYSKNNYLSALVVDGYELSPAFNKETTEYTVTLDSNVEKINVNAALEDNTASMEGLGEKTVSDGENIIKINITAQSGDVLTYVIKANVKDLNPIKLKINDNDYTVIKKKSSLTSPINYMETTVKIGEDEIPAFKSDLTKYTLIGVKDKDGNINYCIYENNKCTLYKEYNFSNTRLYPIAVEDSKIPAGYKKSTVYMNDEEIVGYIKEGYYPLIYGKNLDTGYEHFYNYDKTENSIQIFNEIKEKKNSNNLYYIIIGSLGVLSLGLLISLIIVIIINSNKKTKEII